MSSSRYFFGPKTLSNVLSFFWTTQYILCKYLTLFGPQINIAGKLFYEKVRINGCLIRLICFVCEGQNMCTKKPTNDKHPALFIYVIPLTGSDKLYSILICSKEILLEASLIEKCWYNADYHHKWLQFLAYNSFLLYISLNYAITKKCLRHPVSSHIINQARITSINFSCRSHKIKKMSS